MKVLTIGNFGRGWDGSICDEEHIAQALAITGVEVERWQREDVAFGSAPSNCDFVLISQWDGYPENFIQILRDATKAKIVYWAFDYQADGQAWHERLVNGCDLYLSKRIADSKYPNWQWFSQDFAPIFLHKIPPVKKDIDVLFTGSYLPWATERNETLKYIDERFNLVIHSVNSWDGFKDVRPPIMDHGLPELYARAKIIISIDHTIEAGYWSDRNAQIIACGGRPLFRYVPLSEQRFHDDVDYFYNKEQLEAEIAARLSGKMPYMWYTSSNKYNVISKVEDLLVIVKGIL